MVSTDLKYSQYLQILREELIPAMGCTEPIAMAYAAAKAREVLGSVPERIDIVISGNIIKNVKSVVVPHTGGLRGIGAAAAIAGHHSHTGFRLCSGAIFPDTASQTPEGTFSSASRTTDLTYRSNLFSVSTDISILFFFNP